MPEVVNGSGVDFHTSDSVMWLDVLPSSMIVLGGGYVAGPVSATEDEGRIVVDEFGRAGPGIWRLGDCSSPFELKHVANAEARTVAHNLAHPGDLRAFPHMSVPAAVFADPQVASVGARSQDLEPGSYIEVVQEYRKVAYGWAMGDPMGI